MEYERCLLLALGLEVSETSNVAASSVDGQARPLALGGKTTFGAFGDFRNEFHLWFALLAFGLRT